MRILVTTIFVLGALANLVHAQVPSDVPRDHWAYEAVKGLIERGYLEGYPDGNFLGQRAMTRYELAVLIKRIVDDVFARIEDLGVSDDNDSKPSDVVKPERPVQVGVESADLEKLRRLLEEFKPELAVIGVRLDKVESDLEELSKKVADLGSIVKGSKDALEAVKSDVSKLKKVTVSGYIQARYQTIDPANESESARDYTDTFMIRRARVKVTAKSTTRATLVFQFELAKNSVGVKDSYLIYKLFGDNHHSPEFSIGQMNWPFGYEVPTSSSVREAPERVLVARRLFPGERDQGAKLQGNLGRVFKWQLGAFNGTGIEKGSSSDRNTRKDIIFNIKGGLKNLNVGLSYYGGRGVWQEFNKTFLDAVKKSRYGIDLQYNLSDLTLKAEWFRGRGVDEADRSWDQSRYVSGYYAQVSYNIFRENQFVTRYSTISIDPVKPQYGRINSWDIGIVHWLDDHNRLKLFYKINQEEKNSLDNNGLVVEWIGKY